MQQILNFCKIGPNQEVIYNENDILGNGTSGIVYAGKINKDMKQNVAVKKLYLKSNQLKQIDSNFERDRNNLQKLNNPYLPKHYFTYIDPKTDAFFIVTERYSSSIQQQIKNNEINTERVFKYAYQLVIGMKYLHTQGIIHRDIKPSNIMINQQDNIKITGFDSVKWIPQIQNNTQPTSYCPPMYAAPQILFLQKYSEKCDVWSTGCLIYQLLTKKKLFAKGTALMLLKNELKKFKEPEKKTQILSQIKDEFWNKILQKMLIYQDQQRTSFHQLLSFFTQQNKNKYHIDIQSEKEQKTQVKSVQANEQKTIIKNPIKINRLNPKQDLNIEKKDLKTNPILATHQIQKAIDDYKFLLKMMNLKYQKIKLTYKCIYQFQVAKHYPTTYFVRSVITFLSLLWYKMEILDFWKQFKDDQSIIFQGKKLDLKGNQLAQVQLFFNTRNKIFNEFMDKMNKVDGHLKQYVDFILKSKYQLDQNTLQQAYPQIFDYIKQYTSIETKSELILQLLKKYFKQQGIPTDKIDKMQSSQKLKTYILIGRLCLLFSKNTEFPNTYPYDSNILNKKIDEIEGMKLEEILKLIERLK